MGDNNRDQQVVQAGRILVANALVGAFARNIEARNDKAMAARLYAELSADLQNGGTIVIDDPSIKIHGEYMSLHVVLEIIPREKVPSYSVPNDRCERGLRQQFAMFRAASESFWREFSQMVQYASLPPLRIFSETVYGWDEDMPWRVGVTTFFASKSGKKYIHDA